jgi:hypothetical protein
MIDHGRAIVADLAGEAEELASPSFMLIELTIGLPDTHFRPGLDHAPFGAVDHEGDAGDVRLGRDQLQVGDHGMLGVEQAFVHVDVDDLRAVLDLLARDFDGGGVVAGHDQLLEGGGAGDVGALADIDESAETPPLSLQGRGWRASARRVRVNAAAMTRTLNTFETDQPLTRLASGPPSPLQGEGLYSRQRHRGDAGEAGAAAAFGGEEPGS